MSINRELHNIPAQCQRGVTVHSLPIKSIKSHFGLVCPVAKCIHCGQILVYLEGDPGRVVFSIAKEDLHSDSRDLGGVLCLECGVSSWAGHEMVTESLWHLRLILGEGRIVFPVVVRVNHCPEGGHMYKTPDALIAACEVAISEGLTPIHLTMAI